MRRSAIMLRGREAPDVSSLGAVSCCTEIDERGLIYGPRMPADIDRWEMRCPSDAALVWIALFAMFVACRNESRLPRQWRRVRATE